MTSSFATPSLLYGSRTDCLQSVAGTFAHTACTYSPCLQRLLSLRVFQDVYVLRAVLGQALILAFPGRAASARFLLCVYAVLMLLRYFEPDSCPALLSDAEVEVAVQKMLRLIDTMSSCPGFTSSIICCALSKTTRTATDSIHRCHRMPRQSTVVHRDTLLRSHFFGLQGTQWVQNSVKGAWCTLTRGERLPRTP